MMVRKATHVDEEEPLFQMFFLKDDVGQNVEVVEVKKIDFKEVERRLGKRESVFITRKHNQRLNTTLVAEETVTELWHFDRM
ncbi:MAG: hypothetical protein PVF15_04055 [Candidatus Bathyarchaeota archaeon]|jgi:hypothetical protein